MYIHDDVVKYNDEFDNCTIYIWHQVNKKPFFDCPKDDGTGPIKTRIYVIGREAEVFKLRKLNSLKIKIENPEENGKLWKDEKIFLDSFVNILRTATLIFYSTLI